VPLSESEKLRNKGNAIYQRASAAGINVELRKGRLEQALRFYRSAQQQATCLVDLLAAMKNIGTSNRRLFEHELDKGDAIRASFFLKEAAKSYAVVVREFRPDVKSAEWLDHIVLASIETIDAAAQLAADAGAAAGWNWRQKAGMLESVAALFTNELHAYAQLSIAKMMMHAAFMLESSLGEDGDEEAGSELSGVCERWKKVKYLMEEVSMPLERAQYAISQAVQAPHASGSALSPSDKIQSLQLQLTEQLDSARQDRSTLVARAEAYQAIAVGDSLIAQQFEEEELPVDLLWEAIDWYHRGMSIATGIDTECEATCASKLGHIFEKWLRNETKADVFYTHVILLTSDLTANIGMRFHACQWYIRAREAKERFQQKRWDTEQKRRSEDRKGAREEIQVELEALQGCMEGESKAAQAFGLLTHIYANHPPKKEQWRDDGVKLLAELGKEENKYDKKKRQKALVRASLHYHPDKNANHGMPHLVLCEEIQKLLNRCNDSAKGLD
jgi:hypothetical protein